MGQIEGYKCCAAFLPVLLFWIPVDEELATNSKFLSLPPDASRSLKDKSGPKIREVFKILNLNHL